MADRSLLNALSPQLQQLVAESLGENLPIQMSPPLPPPAAGAVEPIERQESTQSELQDGAQAAKCSTSASSTRFNPSEVFGACIYMDLPCF